ncbi:hypothetical protein IEO21_07648 [Rhodonia placenta]|uniref:Nephrocystin 3-like N-terminal domain-containing protein n=1 Tax=Rhodonia placenta TaxID=104341 RepID=A0A8H7NXR3_9APHY|nr:hypothetical protein IEO21_07648 [Postia placenta]
MPREADTTVWSQAVARLLIDQGVCQTLDDLKPALEAGYRSIVHSAKAQHLEGTRVDLINEIYDWVTDSPNAPKHHIHILTGVAGAGKSTIASYIAKRLDDEGKLGASFFFDRGSHGLNTTHSVFTTLAYQLAQQQLVTLGYHFVDAARSYLQRGSDQQMEYALDELILRPLRIIRPNRPVILVIDALDECTERTEELVPQMLRLLANMVSNTDIPFRILLTSRPEYYIEEVLRSAEFSKDNHRFRLQDVPRHTVDADIQLYLESSLEKIPSAAKQLATPPDAIPTLAMRTEGLFIYASTVIKIPQQDPEHACAIVDELVQNQPSHHYSNLSHLDQLCLVVLQIAFPREDHHADSIRGVLTCITLLRDHLTPGALASLMRISVENVFFVINRLASVILIEEDVEGNVQDLERDIERLVWDAEDPEWDVKSLEWGVEGEGHIRPLHASFPQFLANPSRCKDPRFCIEPSIHHERMAVACLVVMLEHLHRNILQFSDPLIFDHENHARVHERVDRFLPLHARYASAHWAFHLCHAICTVDLLALLEAFLAQKILCWFEVLSLTGMLGDAPSALLDIRLWYRVSGVCVSSKIVN